MANLFSSSTNEKVVLYVLAFASLLHYNISCKRSFGSTSSSLQQQKSGCQIAYVSKSKRNLISVLRMSGNQCLSIDDEKLYLIKYDYVGAGDQENLADDAHDGKVRRKMAVGEGRSMMHWQRLKVPIQRRSSVTMEEVRLQPLRLQNITQRPLTLDFIGVCSLPKIA
jgi:hypothetical protein